MFLKLLKLYSSWAQFYTNRSRLGSTLMLATKDSNEPTDRSKTISSASLGITIGLINHDKGHIIINCQLDIRPCNKISQYLKTTALLSRNVSAFCWWKIRSQQQNRATSSSLDLQEAKQTIDWFEHNAQRCATGQQQQLRVMNKNKADNWRRPACMPMHIAGISCAKLPKLKLCLLWPW